MGATLQASSSWKGKRTRCWENDGRNGRERKGKERKGKIPYAMKRKPGRQI